MNEQYIEDSYPLSPLQQGMLFHSLYAPQSGVFIPQMIWTLHEDLNVSAFKQAWEQVVKRHPILRTSFHWEGLEEPLQKVHQQVNLPLIQEDWRGLSAQEQESRLETYLHTDLRHDFEFTKSPLMRLALFQISETDYQFIWTYHHVLLDGQSRLLIVKEIFAYYEAFCQGYDLKLKQPRPYRAHIEWLQQHNLSKAKAFWQQTLKGFSAPTSLIQDPVTDSVLAREKVVMSEQDITLSNADTSALKSLAQQYGLTLNTVLQGAWVLLLSRYSGSEDVVFGATRACRHSTVKEAKDIVGLFINVLPIRVQVSPEMLLIPWLKKLRAQWITMREYEQTSHLKIQEWSDIPPGTPLFESTHDFRYSSVESALPEQGGNWKRRKFRILHQSNVPLSFQGFGETELLLKIQYNRGRFDTITIERMFRHYKTLLEGIIANPKRRLLDLPLLTETERFQLLMEWNDTQATYPQDQCIHQLFETQADRTPDGIAVVFEDKQITYHELNTRANQLAHYLQRHGVGPEVRVGLCLNRSIEMIVAVLGIFKAGGAYVPMDPNYPQERLAFMAKVADLRVNLTQEKFQEHLAHLGGEHIHLDSDWPVISQEKVATPVNQGSADSLAYVIFTSGSTGRPKGVEVEHRQVLNYVDGILEQLKLPAGSSFAMVSPLTADLGNTMLYPALATGGTLHIISEDRATDPEALGAYFKHHQPDCLKIVPSHLATLLMGATPAEVLPQKRLVVGGEACPWQLVEKVQALKPGCRVINHYGPTETTVGVTTYQVEATDRTTIHSPSVPIGRPLPNSQLYILDSHKNPVPPSVAGEVYIGGRGLARGYAGAPEVTAEKFIPHPYSEEPGARLYKTGDRAKFQPDGTIEFLGRIDHQVKIRGFRIELGEVESALGRHPAVEEAVVIAREDVPGDKRLMAYVVVSHEPTPTFSELRSFLKEKLPDYMIPTALVFLDLLPLTPNCKVDRRALPAPDVVRPDLQEAFVAPRSQSEELVAGIWSNVLGLERIGVYDSFFELGGHSLLVVQIISRIRGVFEVELAVRSLFEAPTVAELTERIEAARTSDEGLQTSPLQAVSRDQDLPLSFAQQRLWFLHHLEPDSVAYSMPRSIRLKGVLRTDALENTYVELARRHETLRTTFHSTDGHPVLRIAAEPNIVFDTLDLRHLPEVEREAKARRLSAEDARKPFNLTQGPLFRIRLFQLEDQEHVLHSNMHHIISDFWSSGVMSREIAALYTAFIKGKSADLPELPVQYADYGLWQRQWLQGEALEAQLNYWKDKLGGELPVLELPTDRPRPAVQTHRGAIESLALPKELTEALQAMSRREGVTLFMTLLAAFKTLLYRLTGQEDTIVGTPIAGRNRTELEGLIGFFMNTIVMRTDLSGQPSFRELLGRVRETALGAYAHQDMPFEKLVEELSPERDLSRPPLFQVFFNYIVAMGDKAVVLPGLEAEAFGGLDPESKFDMTLYVLEGEGGIELRSLYNTDLFDSWRMAEMLKQYEALLKQIVENSDEKILHYSLVTAAVKARLPDPIELLPSQWEGAIHKRFSEQAHVGPDQVAVLDRLDSWTYGELDCRSNQLANFLLEDSVQLGDVVAIYAHRSASLVWALLGILKAGAAFVILDPAYPTQCLIDILQAAKPKAWFQIEAAGELAEELTENVEAQLTNCHLVLPGLASAVELGLLEDYSDKDPEIVVGPDDLAYVAFTSGTTGEPRGIVGTHGPLSHFVNWHIEKFNFNESDHFSMLSGLSHDPLLRDIFAPLWAGATLCIPEPEKILFPPKLISWMSARQVTVAHMTPALGEVFAEGAQEAESIKEILSSIRYIFFGGDVLTWRQIEKVKQIAPSAELVNYYGATETPQGMGCHVVDARKKAHFADCIPLGKGIEGVQLLVLNAAGRLAGVGEIAEVHVRTPYLSKGYLNDKTLTDAKFIGNPYTNTEDDIIYKTGDLGRYLPDGQVMFHGRSDSQVSLRGFRIELGAVEATLCLHPSLSEAVVVAREDRPGDKRLVAYVVAAVAESVPSTGVLRAFLQERLPDYMIPSAFVSMDTLPLTANRKVDRRALPAPDVVRPELQEAFVAPRSQSEELVAGMWSNLLGVERIGVHDNFFEIGGHSLLATRVVSRIQQEFQVDLKLMDFFKMPTIAELTKGIEGLLWINAGIPSDDEAELQDKEEGVV